MKMYDGSNVTKGPTCCSPQQMNSGAKPIQQPAGAGNKVATEHPYATKPGGLYTGKKGSLDRNGK